MNDCPPCPECGKPVPAESQHRLCPACLLAQAMASRTLDEGAPGEPAGAPLEPDEIADKFPQFEILECLGRGGMGVVYKARQKSLNRLVAIKILAPEREHDAKFAGRFAREAELLAKLGHPHIVTIHDFGETGGLYYLVMEFINGVNLRDLMREGKMAPEQALAIVPPVCEALQYAHEQGIVHRDIKPENILLDKEGRVKIADFGIATLVGDAGEASGTPAYMAPEQQSVVRIVDHRADIYALGVVLYEMLTGERPTALPVAPSKRIQIDVRLDEVVLRALSQEPERRFQTAADFRTVVETMAAERHVPVPGEWLLRCTTCHHTRSLAGAGGTRIGAASIGKRTIAWCRSCGGLRFAAVEKAGGTPRPVAVAAVASGWQKGVDYRSSRQFLGIPLVHISSGIDPVTGNRRMSLGWLAVGDVAVGFFSFGGVAIGAFSFGGVALGLLGFGGLALGLVAIGGVGVGLLGAFAGLAVGGVAVGGMAVGYYAHGGSAEGKYLLSPLVQHPEAIRFFQPWAGTMLSTFMYWNGAVLALVLGVNIGAMRWAMVKGNSPSRAAATPPPVNHTNGNSFWKLLLHFAPALLLAIAIFTSGLERGAVLILAIVIVATLTISTLKGTPLSKRLVFPLLVGSLLLGLGALAYNRSGKSVPPVAVELPSPAAGAAAPGLASKGLELRWFAENAAEGAVFLQVPGLRTGEDAKEYLLSEVAADERDLHDVRLTPAETGKGYLVLELNADAKARLEAQSRTKTAGQALAVLWEGRVLGAIRPGLAVPRVFDVNLGHAELDAVAMVKAVSERIPDGSHLVQVDGVGSFNTISSALFAAPENSVIRIPEGTFKERLVIAKPVKLIGAGWEKTRIEASGDPVPISATEALPVKPVVKIETEGEVLLEGLGMSLRTEKAHAGGLADIAVLRSNKAKLTMKHCAVLGSPGNGIEVREAAGGLIENCLVAGVWNTGIALVGNRITVQNCDVRNCYHRGITIADKGWGKTTIRDSRISGSAWHGIRYDDCSPVITGNVIRGNARSGIYLSGNTAGEIFGNVLAKNEMGSISCWFESRDRIVRNILADDGREAVAVLGLASPLVRGNIFIGQGIRQSQIGDERLTAKAVGTPVIENNLFWGVKVPFEKGYQETPGILPLPEGNRTEDPKLGENYSIPDGSPLRKERIGPEMNPVSESAYPIQPEEKAIMPEGEGRDFRLWKR